MEDETSLDPDDLEESSKTNIEDFICQREMNMRKNSKMEKIMDMEYFILLYDLNMKIILKMEYMKNFFLIFIK